MTREYLYDEIVCYIHDNTISDLMNIVNDAIRYTEDWQAETIRLEIENEYGEYKNKYLAVKRCIDSDGRY